MRVRYRVMVCVGFVALLVMSATAYVQSEPDPTDLDADAVPGLRSDGDWNPRVPFLTPGGRLLVDRSHGQDFDISGFGGYLISQGWTVDYEITGPITEALLGSYDIFMVPAKAWYGITTFSAAEVAAVGDYVAGGGGLWVFHEYTTYPDGVNSVSSQFSVTFNRNTIHDPTDNEGESMWPTIHILASHPVTEGVSSYGYYAGCCLNVDDPAITIAMGDDDAGSWSCPSYAPVLAAATVGGGRAVFSGDQTPLHPSYYLGGLRDEEKLLLKNIVCWLAPNWPSTTGEVCWGAVKALYR